VPVENGRPVLRRPEPEGKPLQVSQEDLALVQTARQAGKDAKRAMARLMRKKLADLDGGTFEKSVVRMMHRLHFREVKVAKRSKEGPLLTARRREGSLELRYAVRLLKGNAQVERRHVQELRRDLSHYSANIGVFVSPGDARGDAKTDATAGQLVFLWCGEGLAEMFFEAQTGVKVQTVELYEIDEAFFAEAARDAEEARQRREERQREREQQEPQPSEPPAAEAPPAPEGAAEAPPAQAEGDDGDDGDDEGPDEGGDEGEGPPAPGQEGQAGAPGSGGRRRRRRRRGRRGRGNRPEGAPGQAGAAPPAEGGAPPAPTAEPPAAPPPPSSGGGGESGQA